MFADDTTIPLPALYVESTDPTTIYADGRSFSKRMWLDTSTGVIGVLKKRNPANDGWDTLINLDAAAATLTTEQVQDIVGAMFPDVATIDWTYDDATGVVTGVVIGAAPTGSAGGDLTGSYPNPTIMTDAVTNAKLANMAQATIKGRASGAGTGDPADLSATQVRSILLDMQRWTVNFTANGDAYIPADVAMTVDAGVAAIGTGTLAYEKSTAAAPSIFSSASLPITLEAGAWLKVTVSSLSGFKALELKRTA